MLEAPIPTWRTRLLQGSPCQPMPLLSTPCRWFYSLPRTQARLPLAKMAVAETGMGLVEDKVIKNHFASEFVFNKYKDLKTCDIIERDPQGAPRLPPPALIVSWEGGCMSTDADLRNCARPKCD